MAHSFSASVLQQRERTEFCFLKHITVSLSDCSRISAAVEKLREAGAQSTSRIGEHTRHVCILKNHTVFQRDSFRILQRSRSHRRPVRIPSFRAQSGTGKRHEITDSESETSLLSDLSRISQRLRSYARPGRSRSFWTCRTTWGGWCRPGLRSRACSWAREKRSASFRLVIQPFPLTFGPTFSKWGETVCFCLLRLSDVFRLQIPGPNGGVFFRSGILNLLHRSWAWEKR